MPLRFLFVHDVQLDLRYADRMTRPRRHHYLPLFLLSAFAVKRRGRTSQVRVLRKDGVFETAATNVGVEKNFHSTAGIFTDPEGILSRREGEYAAAISRWSAGRLSPADAAVADDFVGHLRLRSRVMREMGRLLIEPMFAQGAAAYAEQLREMAPAKRMSEEIADLIGDRLSNVPRSQLGGAVDRHLLPVLQRHIASWVLEEAGHLMQVVCNEKLSRELLSGTHTHLILLQVLNRAQGRTLRGWHWKVLRTDKPVLLGDSGPVSVTRESRVLTSFNAAAMENACAVLLPLAPRRLLVGSESIRFRPPTIAKLNNATIELSYEFVVGTQSQAWLKRQREQFGRRSDHHTPGLALGVEPPNPRPVIADAIGMAHTFVSETVAKRWGRITDASPLDVETVPVDSTAPSDSIS